MGVLAIPALACPPHEQSGGSDFAYRAHGCTVDDNKSNRRVLGLMLRGLLNVVVEELVDGTAVLEPRVAGCSEP